MQPWWQQPFFQVALPIIITFVVATWYQSKRVDDLRDSLGRRIDELRESLGKRITDQGESLSERITGQGNSIGARLDVIDRRLERIENLLSDHALGLPA